MKVSPPKPATLKKYGLTEQEWLDILESQGGVCAVCRKVPKSGRLVIDHEHRKDWAKGSDEERKKAVRGALCWYCNRMFLARGMTTERAENLVLYLKRYEEKQAAEDVEVPEGVVWEALVEGGRKSGKQSRARGTGIFGMTPQQKAEHSKRCGHIVGLMHVESGHIKVMTSASIESTRRPVVCLNDPETGAPREFPSTHEAQRVYQIGNVNAVLKGRRTASKGLRFVYAEDFQSLETYETRMALSGSRG